MTAGLEEAEVERWLAAASPGVNPSPNGDGRGVVERFSAGLEAGAEVWPGSGRDPMGPTDPMGPAVGFGGP